MNIATSIKTETVTTDTTYIGDRVIRVHGAIPCPRCLRGRLRAGGVREIGEHQSRGPARNATPMPSRSVWTESPLGDAP